MTTTETLRAFVERRFGGVLSHGSNASGGAKACALEAMHAYQGDEWSDKPGGWLDIRPLNDGPWSSDAARTAALLPLAEALLAATPARIRAALPVIAVETVRQVIADLPGLDPAIAARCRAALTPKQAARAAAAAYAAYSAADADAATAAYAAAAAAATAATTTAAAYADADAAAHAAYAAADAATADATTADAATADAAPATDAILTTACALWTQALKEAQIGLRR